MATIWSSMVVDQSLDSYVLASKWHSSFVALN
jgi:hypothetical protein